MKETGWEQQIKWGITAFAVIAGGAGVVFFILHISDVKNWLGMLAHILAPVIYGAVMAYLTAPFYNRVYAGTMRLLSSAAGGRRFVHHAAKTIATIAATALLCVIALGLIYMIIPEIYSSVMSLIETMPQNANDLYNWMQKTLDNPEVRTQVLNAYNSALSYIEGYVQNTVLPGLRGLIGSVSLGIWKAVMWLKDICIGVIVMMYLLNVKETLVGQARKLTFACLPEKWAARTIREFEYINKVFGGFITGKLLDSLIIGILCFAVLSIMKMPYTMLVSVIVGVTNVIPFFGPFIGAVPSFILILLVSPRQSLYFLVFIFLLQQFDGNVLGPKILGDSTGIPSFWVLFSILLFGGLLGFAGMIIAVPTWAVLLNLIDRISRRILEKKGLSVHSRDYLKKEETERV